MDETIGDLPAVLKPREVAELSRCSLNTIYKLIRDGQLPARRFGSAIRIPRAAVLDMLGSDA
jgi:excisionase family DNA binding protein